MYNRIKYLKNRIADRKAILAKHSSPGPMLKIHLADLKRRLHKDCILLTTLKQELRNGKA